ncbi:hypothetical protein SESBI_36009, partial [Sesbania bispinosa]
MVLYEHSDVVQWGIDLFDGDPGYSPGYYGDIIQHDTGDIYNGHYFHSHYDTEYNQVENDEIIAQTLQEEFSRLAIAECSRYSHADEEQFHASEPTYDWHNTSMTNYYSGGRRLSQMIPIPHVPKIMEKFLQLMKQLLIIKGFLD